MEKGTNFRRLLTSMWSSQPVEYDWQQIIRAWVSLPDSYVVRQLELEDGDAGVPSKAGS